MLLFAPCWKMPLIMTLFWGEVIFFNKLEGNWPGSICLVIELDTSFFWGMALAISVIMEEDPSLLCFWSADTNCLLLGVSTLKQASLLLSPPPLELEAKENCELCCLFSPKTLKKFAISLLLSSVLGKEDVFFDELEEESSFSSESKFLSIHMRIKDPEFLADILSFSIRFFKQERTFSQSEVEVDRTTEPSEVNPGKLYFDGFLTTSNKDAS
ncbi:wsv345 [White spot syndrome virus]|uniref:Wsv345 n=4 Tax=White spot syndrome virus TaxID=342409 RepID=Q8VAQ6_WSSVS|nr:wsv345 [Shrimp white spot syndrome virus]AFX59722.1 wsv345 [White spot syndrome virus]AAL33347.1 wsv345 [Shrimp white spot syndrome virus]AAL89269.1 WSSV401 [Shrimp white spot syndrome virus]AWQ60474.1 wsv345 [Shrimp white spot syndrome virus]AWQ60917.1 wsv345 [Shrimp white spot syndrome virus]